MSPDSRRRLIILGFDGTSPDLLSRWVADGHLPNIQRMIERGCYGPLQSVPNMSSAAAWPTFATGNNPGKHGIFRFTERNFNTYGYKYVNGGFRRSETFWHMLCGVDSSRTGCVINVPMTYPAERLNGCMISGLDAPGVDSEGICYPKGLIAELKAKVGPYQIITRDFADLLRKGGDWGSVAERLLSAMDMRFQHTRYLMGKYDCDLFVTVFNETDLAHHFYWKFIDQKHPDYKAEEARIHGDTILRVYQKMDEITGRYVEENPEATFFIVSDHGGGINTRGGALVQDWLEDLGLLTTQEKQKQTVRHIFGGAVTRLARLGYQQLDKRLSTDMKMRLARALPGLRESVESAVRLGGIDWTKTKAFCDGVQDEIWINLKGRDPLGIVDENEYEKVCEFICSELKSAVDISTNRPIIDTVFRREEAYHGEYIDRAADIIFNWRPDAVITGIKSKHSTGKVAPATWKWPADLPTGGHSLNGVFIATGPSVEQGVTLARAQLADVAPTVIYCFGEEIPDGLDGRVLTEIFGQQYLSGNPPRYSSKETRVAKGEDVYSEEDNSVIEQRLKDLGYI